MREVLLVTGSSGIAAATARMWPAGNPVFIISSEHAAIGEAECCVVDVRDETAVRDAVHACIARFGQIDAVFNVAGISARPFGDGPLHECTSEGWDAAMDVNAKGTFHVCREVLRVSARVERSSVHLYKKSQRLALALGCASLAVAKFGPPGLTKQPGPAHPAAGVRESMQCHSTHRISAFTPHQSRARLRRGRRHARNAAGACFWVRSRD